MVTNLTEQMLNPLTESFLMEHGGRVDEISEALDGAFEILEPRGAEQVDAAADEWRTSTDEESLQFRLLCDGFDFECSAFEESGPCDRLEDRIAGHLLDFVGRLNTAIDLLGAMSGFHQAYDDLISSGVCDRDALKKTRVYRAWKSAGCPSNAGGFIQQTVS